MITVEKILLEYDSVPTNLLPALKKISAAFGYINEKDAGKVAVYFTLPLSKVYETASFYDLLKTKKQPQLVIRVCSGSNCTVTGAADIISGIESFFHIKAGDSNNQRVKLEIISCLERCGEGPVMVINNKIFTRVTKSSVFGILDKWL